MAGLNGIGALAEGFARGLRLSSDMQDAEKRRGLMDTQEQREKQQIEREKELAGIRTEIANEVSGFKPSGPDDVDGFNAHYDRLKPLMMKQAALSGVDPLLVEQSVDDKRRNKYAERLYTALGDIQAGNAAGFDKLKPVYNQMFKDNGTLLGGAYDQKTDSITMNFTAPGDANGKQQSVTMPREAFVRQAFAYLNTGDAIRFEAKDLAEQRKTKQEQDFQSGQTDKKIASAEKIAKEENASRERVGASNNAAHIRGAEIGAVDRAGRALNAREEKDYNDFQAQINDSLGWNKSNRLVTPDQLAKRNKDAAAMTNIFNTTREVAGKKLSAYEAAQVIKGIEGGTAKYADKGGYTIVDVGGVRAVLPKQ